LLLLLGGCRGCVGGAGGVTTEPLRVSGGPLRFEDTWVGTERSLSLELSNPSRVSQSVALAVDPPFFLAAPEARVAGGSTEQVAVVFRPTSPGASTAVLTVGEVTVEVSGLALEVPACVPASSCEAAAFDTGLGACLRAPQPDGTACTGQCVRGGQCQAGACVGAPVDCSDGDACTVDACGGAGCAHTPRTCPPPTNPCKVAACDSMSGCGELDADDGTVCGSDACTEANVSVCIAGQCVQRTRPLTERCSNTWVPLRLPTSLGSALAYDPVRSQLLTTVGRQTWLWDGTTWSQRFPPAAPAAGQPAFATDTRRNRVVAFFGGETWEWDGVTWLLRATTALGPGARGGAALAYDPVRRVTVLFGGLGASNTPRADTWEWNGLRWTARTTAHSPSARFGASMAWDPSRSRVLLFAGTFDYFVGSSDTWEFDGTDWVARTFASTPPPRYGASLTWDPVRSVFVAVGGTAYDPLDDIWELDGSRWSMRGRTPVRMQSHGAAWDERASRLVVLHRGVTFAFDGQTLVPIGRSVLSERSSPMVAFDATRARLTLFGGYPSLSPAPLYPSVNDTWVRDASGWTELSPGTSPAARYGGALTWDVVRQRLVLFGGTSEINSPAGVVGRTFSDTWTFDGTAWSQLSPTASPPAGSSVGTWDEAMQRVVVLSGGTWGFDGTTWSSVATGGPPLGSALAYDPQTQRLMAVYRDETWAVINSAWARLTPLTPLPATFATGRVVWDPSRQRVLLQGDRGTFVWNGADWAQLQPTAQPLEAPESLVFDAAAGRPVAINRGGEWTLLP
jgi:hypothetical protein